MIKYYEGPTFELYNLAEDISEKNNLAIKHSDKVKQLESKLSAHLKTVGAKLPRLNQNYNGTKD